MWHYIESDIMEFRVYPTWNVMDRMLGAQRVTEIWNYGIRYMHYTGEFQRRRHGKIRINIYWHTRGEWYDGI